MIMSEHLVFKFQSYVLFPNTATKLSELSIKEYWDAGFESLMSMMHRLCTMLETFIHTWLKGYKG